MSYIMSDASEEIFRNIEASGPLNRAFILLPPGYKLEWGGEYEDSKNAQAALAASLPTFIGMMILITILLFNKVRAQYCS